MSFHSLSLSFSPFFLVMLPAFLVTKLIVLLIQVFKVGTPRQQEYLLLSNVCLSSSLRNFVVVVVVVVVSVDVVFASSWQTSGYTKQDKHRLKTMWLRITKECCKRLSNTLFSTRDKRKVFVSCLVLCIFNTCR